MKRAYYSWNLWIWLATFITVFAVFFSIPAHADGDITNTEKLYGDTYHSAICSTIADYPSIGGVLGVWQGVQQHSGLTMDNAGDVIDYAVGTYCPQWTSLLQRTASAVTNAQHGQVV